MVVLETKAREKQLHKRIKIDHIEFVKDKRRYISLSVPHKNTHAYSISTLKTVLEMATENVRRKKPKRI
jgi:hypothetical protein